MTEQEKRVFEWAWDMVYEYIAVPDPRDRTNIVGLSRALRDYDEVQFTATVLAAREEWVSGKAREK